MVEEEDKIRIPLHLLLHIWGREIIMVVELQVDMEVVVTIVVTVTTIQHLVDMEEDPMLMEEQAEASQVNIAWISNGDRMCETKTNFKMESKIKMMKW